MEEPLLGKASTTHQPKSEIAVTLAPPSRTLPRPTHSGVPCEHHTGCCGGFSVQWFFSRRQRVLAGGTNYQKAAALIDLAADGQGLPDKVLEKPERLALATQHFYIFKTLDVLWYTNLVVMLGLNFVEIPAWCTQPGPNFCGDPKVLHLGAIPYIQGSRLLVTEILSLILIAVNTFYPILYSGRRQFWYDATHVAQVVTFSLLTVDTICYAGRIYFQDSDVEVTGMLRLAPYLRVLVVILSVKHLRSFAWVLLGIVPYFLTMLTLVVLYLTVTSWIAFIVFQHTEQGRERFPTFLKTFEQMHWMLTGRGNPGVWVPAYHEDRANILFFVPILILNVVFLLSLVLAIVYQAFKRELAKSYEHATKVRRMMLSISFSLVDTFNRGFLDKTQFMNLLRALNTYRAVGQISDEEMHLIFTAIDADSDERISKEEFYELAIAVALKFEKVDEKPFLEEHFPSIYNSTPIQRLKDFVYSRSMENLVNIILVGNLIVMVMEAYHYKPPGSSNTSTSLQQRGGGGGGGGVGGGEVGDVDEIQWQGIEFVFGWIYVAEMFLRIGIKGFYKYWSNMLNRADFVTTWCIAIAQIILLLHVFSHNHVEQYLLVFRTVRVARLLAVVPGYPVIVATFLTLIPSLTPVAGTLFCILSFFSSLGVQLLGGLVYEGNPRLAGTEYLAQHYLDLNFNDHQSAMVTLFQLIMVGPWRVFMAAYVAAANAWWPQIYFFAWTLVGMNFVTKVIISFVLEGFQTERRIAEDYKRMEQRAGANARATGTALDMPGTMHSFKQRKLMSTYELLISKIAVAPPPPTSTPSQSSQHK